MLPVLPVLPVLPLLLLRGSLGAFPFPFPKRVVFGAALAWWREEEEEEEAEEVAEVVVAVAAAAEVGDGSCAGPAESKPESAPDDAVLLRAKSPRVIMASASALIGSEEEGGVDLEWVRLPFPLRLPCAGVVGIFTSTTPSRGEAEKGGGKGG